MSGNHLYPTDPSYSQIFSPNVILLLSKNYSLTQYRQPTSRKLRSEQAIAQRRHTLITAESWHQKRIMRGRKSTVLLNVGVQNSYLQMSISYLIQNWSGPTLLCQFEQPEYTTGLRPHLKAKRKQCSSMQVRLPPCKESDSLG